MSVTSLATLGKKCALARSAVLPLGDKNVAQLERGEKGQKVPIQPVSQSVCQPRSLWRARPFFDSTRLLLFGSNPRQSSLTEAGWLHLSAGLLCW